MKHAVIAFAEQLDAAEVEAPAPSYVELQTFVIERIARTTVFQHPPSKITWHKVAVGTSPSLRFYPAIKPAAWDRLASPIVFSVHVVASGTRTTVFEETLCPREHACHRQWFERAVDLSAWSDQDIDLELTTSSPTGEGVAFGWSGWGDFRIEHTTPTQEEFRPPRRRGRTPNLLLVTCDAMRPDHLGCYGSTRTATPNIDRLAREGLLFEHARAQTETTFGSYCSLLTGVHPMRTGVYAEWGRFPVALAFTPAAPCRRRIPDDHGSQREGAQRPSLRLFTIFSTRRFLRSAIRPNRAASPCDACCAIWREAVESLGSPGCNCSNLIHP